MTEYSPNQVFDNNSPVNLNEKNLQKLKYSGPNDDTITIAFAGDSQRFYDEVEKFTSAVNQHSEVDFVFLAGDITDFGLLAEYEWITTRLEKLHKPFIGVIGNHDVIGNGEAVFKHLFGPVDFSFVYDSVKFIVHNTNSREYVSRNVPDLNFLSAELQPDEAIRNVVAVSHVPPFDDDFDNTLELPYAKLFSETPGFALSLHAHTHKHLDDRPYEDGIRYITSPAFDERKFLMIKIYKGEIFKTIVEY